MSAGRKFATPVALAAAVIAGVGFVALPAQANILDSFAFTYNEVSPAPGSISGTGGFTATNEGGGVYDLNTIWGTANNVTAPTPVPGISEPILGLSSYAGADNVLYYPGTPQFVDFAGISFATLYENYNIYWNGYTGILESSNNPVGYPNAVTIDFSVSQTPLPAALPLFAGGLGAIGLLQPRKKRKAAPSIATI